MSDLTLRTKYCLKGSDVQNDALANGLVLNQGMFRYTTTTVSAKHGPIVQRDADLDAICRPRVDTCRSESQDHSMDLLNRGDAS